jgi:hypothetical protein
MSRLDHVYGAGVQAGIDMVVLGDDHAAIQAGSQDLMQGGDHRRGCLSATDDPYPLDASQIVVTPTDAQQIIAVSNMPADCRAWVDGSQCRPLDSQDRVTVRRVLN